MENDQYVEAIQLFDQAFELDMYYQFTSFIKANEGTEFSHSPHTKRVR